ncbi:MAG: hypothetical protein JRI59_04155 [Deltaproteobacteria bacterium]|nr:hypothetical protein [Deltaproteobacteria bacterium]
MLSSCFTDFYFNYLNHPVLFVIPLLAVALTFIPLVAAYQVWAHHLLRERVSLEDVARQEGY